MKKKNIELETGRSMVEMLGVLAIIGVLSVGGIAGYTSAMNKHRANDTVQRLMRRAVIISSQKQLGQTANLSGFNENDGAYVITLSAGAAANDPTFTLQAENVPEDVCQKLLDFPWSSATISPTPCASGANTMTFTFNNDLSEGGAEAEEACQGVQCGDTCCPPGTACDERPGFCIIDEGVSAEEKDLYCPETDSEGKCERWRYCYDGELNPRDRIVGIPNAYSECGPSGRLFCGTTNEKGQCTYWHDMTYNVCTDIIGTPNANAECGKELYCDETDDKGNCIDVQACDGTNSGDKIVGIPNAYGTCGFDGEELYCEQTNSQGDCRWWSTCKQGKSSGFLIVGTPDAEGVCGDDSTYVCCDKRNAKGQCVDYDNNDHPSCADGGIDCDCVWY